MAIPTKKVPMILLVVKASLKTSREATAVKMIAADTTSGYILEISHLSLFPIRIPYIAKFKPLSTPALPPIRNDLAEGRGVLLPSNTLGVTTKDATTVTITDIH